jgi:hypothetical protein
MQENIKRLFKVGFSHLGEQTLCESPELPEIKFAKAEIVLSDSWNLGEMRLLSACS